MQEEETPSSGYSPAGHVHDIRRQWAVHEDEVLCRVLQNEEFNQHYTGNRTRNAIVREDVQKAREEQLREEEAALEERFRQLQLLQQQAEDDELLAKQLAEQYQMGIEEGSLLDNPAYAGSFVKHGATNVLKSNPLVSEAKCGAKNESRQVLDCVSDLCSTVDNPVAGVSCSQQNTKENLTKLSSNMNGVEKKVVKSIMKPTSSRKEDFTPLLGAAATCSTSEAGPSCSSSRLSPPLAIALALNPELSDKDLPNRLQEEEAKLLQEKLDEVIAFKLQKQLEQMEIDIAKRIEAEDHELAKSIHQKEKERLRRAKERAKLKAASMLSSSSPEHPPVSPNPNSNLVVESSSAYSRSPEQGTTFNDTAATNSSSSSSSRGTHSSTKSSISIDKKSPSSSWSLEHTPPNLPQKTRLDKDDPVTFRATSKALPPNPRSNQPSSSASSSSAESRRLMSKSTSRSHYDDFLPPEEPPPYMPLQGLQNLHKKRNK